MIVVTGTNRSGTSMWMQILTAAGIPALGDRYPDKFKHLVELNPQGFWESKLRMGVNFTNNPDPKTGFYLHPDDTRGHAVKIFVGGLVRTEHSFLDQVIATVRPWREFVESVERLHASEDQVLIDHGTDRAAAVLDERRRFRQARPAALVWWSELYALVRDAAVRRYPFHLVTYSRLLADPEREVGAVLDWLGQGQLEPALTAIRPELRTRDGSEADAGGLDDAAIETFDAVFDALDAPDGGLSADLIRTMNALNARLTEEFPAPGRVDTSGTEESPTE